MNDAVPDSWKTVLEAVLAKPESRHLGGWLKAQENAGKQIYPPRGQRLNALALTPRDQVRVVILGQDPYHGPGQAHGLSFSVADGVKPPPSLVNIFKELRSDLGVEPPPNGNLERWARQGVLLLNNALTVEAHKAGSHAGRGWEAITDACVAAIAAQTHPSVFILWGKHAQTKAGQNGALSGDTPHLILNSPHPSPLSAYRGFFGSRPFSQANTFLKQHGRGTINW